MYFVSLVIWLRLLFIEYTLFFQQIVAYIIFLLYICHGIYKNNKKNEKVY